MGKYEEALERAKQGLPIDEVFPELKESKDDRIRKKIVSAICYYRNDGCISEDEFAACRSWLEKQKEQNTLSTEETELNSIAFLEQLGYTCVPPGAEQNSSTPEDIAAAYQIGLADGRREQKTAEWNEKDKENIDSIIIILTQALSKGFSCKEEVLDLTDWLKSLPERFNLQPKQEWSEEDKETLNAAIHMVEAGNIVFAFEHNKCQVSDWLVSLPQRFNLQSKQEWGDGEKKVLDSIIDDYEKVAKSFCGYDGKIMFLKAIRDGEYLLLHPHWKPSEEQIDALRVYLYHPQYIDNSEDIRIKLVESLYNDLKKLL